MAAPLAASPPLYRAIVHDRGNQQTFSAPAALKRLLFQKRPSMAALLAASPPLR
jgi:hypothetical protein